MQLEINIDKAGRVIIPKDIREEWGFSPEQPLILETTPNGLVLRPSARARMVQHNGMWVYDAQTGVNADIISLIEQVREQRTGDIS